MTYLPRANEPVTPHTHDERMVTENCPICQAQFGGGGTGTVGPAGPAGPAGAAATVAVGTTTTGAAGTNASVTNTGTTSAAVFNFTIPRGAAGATGPAGAAGAAGPAGPAGTDGTSILIQGAVATYADLPADAVAGDCYVVEADGLLYDSDGTGYPPDGAGVPWRGPQGLQGQPGIQGQPGLGLVLRGEVPTYADLPTTGQQQGDLWVVASPTPAHGWAWDAATSTWIDGGQIQGPQGVPGPQGESIVGPPGRDGAPGPAGPTMVSADAGNSSRLGTDGLLFTPTTAPYTLPVATTTTLGGVKSGGDVAVQPDGTMLYIPDAPLVASATQLGVVKIGSGITVTADGTISASGGGTGNYLVKAGDNMTGPLRWSNSGGVSTFNGQDVYMYYDGMYFRCYMPSGRQGWIVEVATGQCLFPNAVPNCNVAPTATGDLTNKKYVDDSFANNTTFLKLAGGTMTGTITAPTNGTAAITFGTTGNTIVGGSGGISLKSGTTNVLTTTAANATFATQIITSNGSTALKFGSAGPTMGVSGTDITASAAINCATAPTVANHLTNKTYVDARTVITAVGAAAPATTGLADGALWVEV